MRTNIEIDDALMNEALSGTGLKTKRETVDLALKTLVRLQRQREFLKLKGKLPWEGDLDAMRTDD
jgi:Arc/MetJ family transcription regulator